MTATINVSVGEAVSEENAERLTRETVAFMDAIMARKGATVTFAPNLSPVAVVEVLLTLADTLNQRAAALDIVERIARSVDAGATVPAGADAFMRKHLGSCRNPTCPVTILAARLGITADGPPAPVNPEPVVEVRGS